MAGRLAASWKRKAPTGPTRSSGPRTASSSAGPTTSGSTSRSGTAGGRASKHHWCGDRDQGDVWQIDRPSDNDLHPTMKPLAADRAGDREQRPAPATSSRPVPRLGLDADRRGAHRPRLLRHGAGRTLCVHSDDALGSLHRPGGSAPWRAALRVFRLAHRLSAPRDVGQHLGGAGREVGAFLLVRGLRLGDPIVLIFFQWSLRSLFDAFALNIGISKASLTTRLHSTRLRAMYGPSKERGWPRVVITNRELPAGTVLQAKFKKQEHSCTVEVDGEGKRAYLIGEQALLQPFGGGQLDHRRRDQRLELLVGPGRDA